MKPEKQRKEKNQGYQDKLALLLAQMGGLQAEVDPQEEEKKNKQLEEARKKLEAQKKHRAEKSSTHPHRGNTGEKVEQQLRLQNLKEKSAPEKESSPRSMAKAAGLKSTLLVDEAELLMTSFGRGNAAICEKKIVGDEITNLNAEPLFSARAEKNQFIISGRVAQNASADNPIASEKKPGEDLIGCRMQMEQLFFGENFADNIHIQVAYSILDIDKILAVHINNIVYQLNNMLRSEELAYTDVVGSLGLNKTAEAFWKIKDEEKPIQKQVRQLLDAPQLAYFGDVLYDSALVKLDKKERNPKRKENLIAQLDAKHKQAYDLLTLLGMMRQALAHGEEGTRTTIFTLDEGYDSIYVKNKVNRVSTEQRLAARKTLDELYFARVAELNEGFLDKAKVDLMILFSIYDALLPEDKKKIVQEYYDFIVRKEYKNQGFSIKHLRELILLKPDANHILSQDYDSMRPRLYRSLDLMIFKYYRDNEKQADAFVESLRGAADNEQKEQFYLREADIVWPALRGKVLNELLPWMDGDELAATRNSVGDRDVTPEMISEIAIKPHANAFCELMYLLTCFLDGKEINDLLTTLINKFETIDSFLSVMKEQGIACKFARGYGMFNKSGMIARELRAINSFARMSKPSPEAKRILFIEAAQVLGYSGDEEALGKYVDDILTEKGKFLANGKGFRNFMINNVIESDRFKYLVRYANVKTVRQLANSRKVVHFVLKDIPDTQIIRYYNSCTGSMRDRCTPDMREGLANLITGITFEQFENVRQKAAGNTPEAQDKVRKQAVIRLYLTVLYLAVKNLVYVNSRYFLAFHCVERDSLICDPQYKDAYKAFPKDFARFARDRVEQGRLNARATRYIQQNMANSDPLMVLGFRNCVEHLGAVRYADKFIGDIAGVDSYYALYHYLVQRYLLEDYEHDAHVTEDMLNPKMPVYFKLLEKHRTYCKDMVKALNVPFAYNLPRYKNLSIAELFDRNNYLPEKGGTTALTPEDAD